MEPAYLPDLIIKTKMFGSKMTHFHWEFLFEEMYFCPPQEGAKLISDVLSVSLSYKSTQFGFSFHFKKQF